MTYDEAADRIEKMEEGLGIRTSSAKVLRDLSDDLDLDEHECVCPFCKCAKLDPEDED